MEDRLARALCECIARNGGGAFVIRSATAVDGGCINHAYTLHDGVRRYFVKINSAARRDMFEAEAEGLRELAAVQALRVPMPVGTGSAGDQAFLVLEHLPLGATADPLRLGRQLAALHAHAGGAHGWKRDNTIGATPQANTPSADWVAFWREQRLRPQFERAWRNGHDELRAPGELLLLRLDEVLEGRTPPPSLLHGDLWGGNVSGLADGTPVLFDPAVYYGDRETDLAMTELFGGFPRSFYRAYNEAAPLDSGYARRKHVYNLYHLLNHLNLFGAGYLGQVRSCMATVG
jgi:fructosamine-3-kinase